jgi:AraC family transcriptional regulator of adaptative response/methylated-DNA-[protein]-cysteine methyltransferase
MQAPVDPLPPPARSSAQHARDYRRVAEALRFIDAQRAKQPDLSRVAEAVGLSEFHFQRLFVRWAGVTPKRFLQFLTKQHAVRLLAEGATVLDAAHATGLSGGGRLHDLLVVAEGVSPGEVRTAYEGVAIAWGVHPSPFGPCLLGTTSRGLCALSFVDDVDAKASPLDDVEARLRRDFPRATLRRDPGATRVLAARIFDRRAPAPSDAPLSVVMRGTPFQLRVWQALLAIPPGAACSYQALAGAIGAPSAVRAVASAVGANRIAYLIPCHRVIRSIGQFGDYAWGAERKRAILGREWAARHPGDGHASAGR